MQPEKKSVTEGSPVFFAVLCLSVSTQGCMQYSGKQCYGGIVKYFVAVPSLHAQKTQ